MTPTDARDPRSDGGDAPRDPWLAQALRHAPDARAAPPPELSARILREARAAEVPMAAPTADTPRAAPFAQAARWPWLRAAWEALARPSVAAGFASVLLATVVGVMWRDRLLDEALPRPEPSARSGPAPAPEARDGATATRPEARGGTTASPQASARPAAPAMATSGTPAPEVGAATPPVLAAPKTAPPGAATPPPQASPQAFPERAREIAPSRPRQERVAASDRASAAAGPVAANADRGGESTAAEATRDDATAAPRDTREAGARDAAAGPAAKAAARSAPAAAPRAQADPAATGGGSPLTALLARVDAAPQHWRWQRDAAAQPMTPALQAWLQRLDQATASRWRSAPGVPPGDSAAPGLQLRRDGAMVATLRIDAAAAWLIPADSSQPAAMATLTSEAAAALSAALADASR